MLCAAPRAIKRAGSMVGPQKAMSGKIRGQSFYYQVLKVKFYRNSMTFDSLDLISYVAGLP